MLECKDSRKYPMYLCKVISYFERSTSRDAKPWSGRQGFALVQKGDFNGS